MLVIEHRCHRHHDSDTDFPVRKTIPDVGEEMLEPFDFIVVTTKNIPDVPPTVGDIIAPAVTPGKTAIVLSQNGLNIEKPLIERFPTNPIVSSVSYISVTSPWEVSPQQQRRAEDRSLCQLRRSSGCSRRSRAAVRGGVQCRGAASALYLLTPLPLPTPGSIG